MQIQLTKDKIAEIDECDGDLAKSSWFAVENKRGYQFYARRRIEGNKQIGMHRLIFERIVGRPLQRNELVDHIDGNGLNDKRTNLRIIDHRMNMKNMHGRHHGMMRSKQLSLF
ncbi:MAG: HNH endonuclease [Methanothrix sp.]